MECLCCHNKSVGAFEKVFPYCQHHEYQVNLALMKVRFGHDVEAINKIIENKNNLVNGAENLTPNIIED
jgi:hypothetical protein